jgi:hypothetical protein
VIQGQVPIEARSTKGFQMSKYFPDKDPERQLPPGENASRIAESLFQLSVAFDGEAGADDELAGGEELGVSEESVGWIIRARRERSRYLPTAVFGDPMWDMLLHLLHAEVTHGRPSVSAVCQASGLPQQVALRWVDSMAQNGFVSVEGDPDPAGGQLIGLAPGASRALRHYVRDVVETR